MTAQIQNTTAPPPWRLAGHGVILVYRFPSTWGSQNGFVPDAMLTSFRGGLSALMMVNYTISPVGPYQEVLFIPGVFRIAGKRCYSISKIYVSTIDSVLRGQENWGIPKELADFRVEFGGDKQRKMTVSVDGQAILQAETQALSFAMPFNSRWLPIRPALWQHWEQTTYVTRPYGSGLIRLARIQDMHIDPNYFPDVSGIRPLLVAHADAFDLTFPEPEVLRAGSDR